MRWGCELGATTADIRPLLESVWSAGAATSYGMPIRGRLRQVSAALRGNAGLAGVASLPVPMYHLPMKLPLLATASILLTTAAVSRASAQSSPSPKWADIERETLQHFQAILQIDTRN